MFSFSGDKEPPIPYTYNTVFTSVFVDILKDPKVFIKWVGGCFENIKLILFELMWFLFRFLMVYDFFLPLYLAAYTRKLLPWLLDKLR